MKITPSRWVPLKRPPKPAIVESHYKAGLDMRTDSFLAERVAYIHLEIRWSKRRILFERCRIKGLNQAARELQARIEQGEQ